MGKDKGAKEPGMMGKMQRLQEALAKAQADLARQTIEASVDRGAVRIVMSGTQECHKVTIAPRLLADGDVDRLEELVCQAVNQAVRESHSLAARSLGPLAGGLGGVGRAG